MSPDPVVGRHNNSLLVGGQTLNMKDVSIVTQTEFYQQEYLSRATFRICENKGAAQLNGNHEAVQHLCLRYRDCTISCTF